MRGVVKEAPSGDTVVVSAAKAGSALPGAEKRLTLSSLVAPKLVSIAGRPTRGRTRCKLHHRLRHSVRRPC